MTIRYEVRSAALTGLPAEVASLGGDLDALLADVGLSRAALDDGDCLIGIEQLTRLLHEAAVRLHCPDLGLRVARHQGVEQSVERGGGIVGTARVHPRGLHHGAARRRQPAESTTRRQRTDVAGVPPRPFSSTVIGSAEPPGSAGARDGVAARALSTPAGGVQL